MENPNNEHMERFENYIVVFVYYENLINGEEISIDDYIKIERDITRKYNMEESILE